MNNSNGHRPAVLITGVSTGIGRACAEALLAAGWQVFGSVRRQADAEAASAALGEGFTPLVFDVTDAAAIAAAAGAVGEALGGRTLQGLVNNAGIAVAGPAAHIPLDEVRHQFEVNVIGQMAVLQAFLPMMGMDPRWQGAPGRVINMSSVSGRIASPFMSPYAMSKHALEALSESLRRELMPYGIDVVIVGPGSIQTPIWAKADDINAEQYAHTGYLEHLKGMRSRMQAFGNAGLPAEDVGVLVRRILESRRPRTRYPILRNRFLMWTLPGLLPRRVVDRILARRFGLDDRA
ncbi:MAG: SDR family oxidoreductase [Steroidobacteraceae bacterium]